MNIEKRVDDLEKRLTAAETADSLDVEDLLLVEGEDGTREEILVRAREAIERNGVGPIVLFRPDGWAEGTR